MRWRSVFNRVPSCFVVTISLNSPSFYNIVGPQKADLITFFRQSCSLSLLLIHLAPESTSWRANYCLVLNSMDIPSTEETLYEAIVSGIDVVHGHAISAIRPCRIISHASSSLFPSRLRLSMVRHPLFHSRDLPFFLCFV